MGCPFAIILIAISAAAQQIVVTSRLTTIISTTVITRPVISFDGQLFTADGSTISIEGVALTLAVPGTVTDRNGRSHTIAVLPGVHIVLVDGETQPVFASDISTSTYITTSTTRFKTQHPTPVDSSATSTPRNASPEASATSLPPAPSSSTTSPHENSTSGLTGGAKAGIGVGVAIGVLLVAVAAYYVGKLGKSKNTKSDGTSRENQAMQIQGDKSTTSPESQPRHELDGRSPTPELPGFLQQGYRPELPTNK